MGGGGGGPTVKSKFLYQIQVRIITIMFQFTILLHSQFHYYIEINLFFVLYYLYAG